MELISNVLRKRHKKSPNNQPNKSLHTWSEHEKQPNHTACGQQQTTVKNTACNGSSKPASDVKSSV